MKKERRDQMHACNNRLDKKQYICIIALHSRPKQEYNAYE